MNREKQEYYLLFWLAAGTVFATVAANRLFAAGIVSYEALYRSIAEGWRIGRPGRILLVRLAQTAAIFWFCRSRRAGMGLSFLLFLAGFIGATALVMFTWNRGWFGLVCFLLSGFPQEGFYLAAWGLMILHCGLGVAVRPGRFWSAVLALFLAGLFLELRLNPLVAGLL